MRSIFLSALVGLFLIPAAHAQMRLPAQPLLKGGVSVLVPPVGWAAGIPILTKAYTTSTGKDAATQMALMSNILQDAESATPASDVVVLPSSIMDQLEYDKGIVSGSRKSIGRMDIALAVPAGAPHPDISTPEKFVQTLKSAKGVVYSDPAGKTMMAWIIQSMLNRPEFEGVHVILAKRGEGNGISFLASGKSGGDMALQLQDEIDSNSKVSDVGPVPPLFAAHIDLDIAVSSRSTHPQKAADVIKYLLSPAADPVWKEHHLVFHR